MWGTRAADIAGGKSERFIPTHVGNTFAQSARLLSPAVHPHACGEHHQCLSQARWVIGSSPRMWGTRALSPAAQLIARFIPTHVGNTGEQVSAPTPEAVHPHACGEHRRAGFFLQSGYGSSPRMWGTLSPGEEMRQFERFIPTHVGNTLPLCAVLLPRPVHPHACGEHVLIQHQNVLHFGSSPRMWGTLFIKKLIKIICYVFKPKLRG